MDTEYQLPNGDRLAKGVAGLTKRETFAAMAMQGMIAGAHTVEHTTNQSVLDQIHEISGDVGVWAVEYADNLLAALEGDSDA